MDHHGRILTRFDDFIEIADRAITHRERQRAVVPDRSFGRKQKAAGKVGGGHVLLRRDGDQRPLQLPGHVFDEAGFAGAGRTFQHDRQPARIGGLEQRDFGADRQVIGFRLDAISFELHGPFLRNSPPE